MPVRTQKRDSGDCGGGTHRGQAACRGESWDFGGDRVEGGHSGRDVTKE